MHPALAPWPCTPPPRQTAHPLEQSIALLLVSQPCPRFSNSAAVRRICRGISARRQRPLANGSRTCSDHLSGLGWRQKADYDMGYSAKWWAYRLDMYGCTMSHRLGLQDHCRRCQAGGIDCTAACQGTCHLGSSWTRPQTHRSLLLPGHGLTLQTITATHFHGHRAWAPAPRHHPRSTGAGGAVPDISHQRHSATHGRVGLHKLGRRQSSDRRSKPRQLCRGDVLHLTPVE